MAYFDYNEVAQTTVTNFITCGDHYLFLHRSKNKEINPDKLNGVGGRLEPDENYLDAAIRETKEETGYEVLEKDVKFCGVVKLTKDYGIDWVMCFFKTNVNSMDLPKGTKTEDGEFVWIHKDKVLNNGLELVDDINYLFNYVVLEKEIFFMTATLDKEHKIVKSSLSKLPNKPQTNL